MNGAVLERVMVWGVYNNGVGKGKGKGHPFAGTEALFRPCGPYGE